MGQDQSSLTVPLRQSETSPVRPVKLKPEEISKRRQAIRRAQEYVPRGDGPPSPEELEHARRLESSQEHLRRPHTNILRLLMGIAVLLAIFQTPSHGFSGKIFKHSQDAFGTASITFAVATLYFGRYELACEPWKSKHTEYIEPDKLKLVHKEPSDGGNGPKSITRAMGQRLNIYAYCRCARSMLPAVVNLVGFTVAVVKLPKRDADEPLNLARYVVAWFEFTIVWLTFLLEVLPWSVRLMLLPHGQVPAALLSRLVFHIRFMAGFSATALLCLSTHNIPSYVTDFLTVCTSRIKSFRAQSCTSERGVESTDASESDDTDDDCCLGGEGGKVMGALCSTALQRYDKLIFLLIDLLFIMPLTIFALLVKITSLRFASDKTINEWARSDFISVALFINNILHIESLHPDHAGKTAGLRRLQELVTFLNAESGPWICELYRQLACVYGNMGAVVAMLSLTEHRVDLLVDREKRLAQRRAKEGNVVLSGILGLQWER